LGRAIDLLKGAAPWAVLGLFASDGHAARTLAAAVGRRRLRTSALAQPDRPVVRRRAGRTAVGTMRKKEHRELLRQRRRLGERLGGDVVCVNCALPGGGLDRAVDGFLAMEMSGWKGRDGGAMACRPGHGEFFRDMCRRFATAGNLQLWSLQVAGRPVAYQCNLVAGDCVFAFKKTYDEALHQYSPGAQLLLDTVVMFHADSRLETYDSCFDSATLSHDLFPDRRGLTDVLLPLGDVLGDAAVIATPYLAAVYRKAKRLRRFAMPATLGPAR
jgi:hypothetical protein